MKLLVIVVSFALVVEGDYRFQAGYSTTKFLADFDYRFQSSYLTNQFLADFVGCTEVDLTPFRRLKWEKMCGGHYDVD